MLPIAHINEMAFLVFAFGQTLLQGLDTGQAGGHVLFSPWHLVTLVWLHRETSSLH